MAKSPIVTRINMLLAERGISKKDFYKDCEITSASYSLWNTGKTQPRMKNLQRIAEYLGVSVADLLPDGAVIQEEDAKKAPTGEGECEFVPSYEDWEKQAESWTLDQLDNAIWKLFQIKMKKEGKHGE